MLLPHLADRAVTRIRWPHGVDDMSFFEKNTPAGTPSWVRTAKVPTTGSRAPSRNGDHAGLPDRRRPRHAHLAGQPRRARAARPPVDGRHATASRATPTGWSSTSTRASRPGCTSAARSRCWCATRSPSATSTPSRSPAAARACTCTPTCRGGCTSDESTALAKEVAEELQAEHPKLVTATMTKARRSGKVFLDWSQNAGSKTTISPYSLRGRERPYVATPVTWDEVEAGAEDPLGARAVPVRGGARAGRGARRPVRLSVSSVAAVAATSASRVPSGDALPISTGRIPRLQAVYPTLTGVWKRAHAKGRPPPSVDASPCSEGLALGGFMEITPVPHRSTRGAWRRLAARAPRPRRRSSLLVLLPAVLGLDRYVMTGGSMEGYARAQGSVVLAREVPPATSASAT